MNPGERAMGNRGVVLGQGRRGSKLRDQLFPVLRNSDAKLGETCFALEVLQAAKAGADIENGEGRREMMNQPGSAGRSRLPGIICGRGCDGVKIIFQRLIQLRGSDAEGLLNGLCDGNFLVLRQSEIRASLRQPV